jgi:hypothetical protein
MIFYAPLRGMREVRDRGSLAPIALMAFLGQVAFHLVARSFAGLSQFALGDGLFWQVREAATAVAVIAVVVVPILTLIANTFERRGSFRVVITQEYAPVAASLFYVMTAASLYSILIAALLHYAASRPQWSLWRYRMRTAGKALFRQTQSKGLKILLSNPRDSFS